MRGFLPKTEAPYRPACLCQPHHLKGSGRTTRTQGKPADPVFFRAPWNAPIKRILERAKSKLQRRMNGLERAFPRARPSLPICLSAYLPICLSAYLPICLSAFKGWHTHHNIKRKEDTNKRYKKYSVAMIFIQKTRSRDLLA